MQYILTVGSRETPEDILELMVYMGWYFTTLGIGISSGDAVGADRAFWHGSVQASNYVDGINRIYLAKEGINGRYSSEGLDFHNALNYDTYEQAKALALQARGSWHGLTDWGIGQHLRNVYQVLGHTLDNPAKCMFYWAPPSGNKEKVTGGTNTALQLAIKNDIQPRINFYYPEKVEKAWKIINKYNPPKLMVDLEFIRGR